MKRRGIAATGAVLVGALSIGLLATPAQAAGLPGLDKFGVAASPWRELSAADIPDYPGGIPATCVFGDSCLTRFWIPTEGFAAVTLESAAKTATKGEAKARLAQVRVLDQTKFAESGTILTWKKVKFPKKQKKANKGVSAWVGTTPLDSGAKFRMAMTVKNKRIAYFAGIPDYYKTNAQLVTPLAKVVRSKSALPRVVGTTKGLAGVLTTLK